MLTWSDIKQQLRRREEVYSHTVEETLWPDLVAGWTYIVDHFETRPCTMNAVRTLTIEVFIAYMEHTYALEDK